MSTVKIGTPPAHAMVPAALLLAACLFGDRLQAQVEEGKVAKYFEFDPSAGVKADVPALNLNDLRKVTLYSKLIIKGAQVQIDDDKYMRRVEPYIEDKELLVVTSDHFQFTILKSGFIPPAALSPEERKRFAFIWIKHATRESPDGKPWLKDLILLPYDKRTLKLVNPWPFAREPGDDGKGESPFFLSAADPRPARAKLPDEKKAVIGTFQSGKASYLVLDVFGGYTWWGKVAATEYLPLRGVDAVTIDQFHKPAQGKAPPKWITGPWTNPLTKQMDVLLAPTPQSVQKLQKRLPQALAVPVRSEKREGWEDLLLLDEVTQPIKDLDDQARVAKNFGELVSWASKFLEKREGGSSYGDWFGPLDKTLAKNATGYIPALRAASLAFRRMGFPSQVIAIHRQSTPSAPLAFLHVYVPSQRISWIFYTGARYQTIIEPEHPGLYRLPSNAYTIHGKMVLFDIHLGGGKPTGTPLPWGSN